MSNIQYPISNVKYGGEQDIRESGNFNLLHTYAGEEACKLTDNMLKFKSLRKQEKVNSRTVDRRFAELFRAHLSGF
jgi:hypothetical protein